MKTKARKQAMIWDREIVPVWSRPFGRFLKEALSASAAATILDAGCGTGYPSMELIEDLPESSRIIGIDVSGARLDIARSHAGSLLGKRIFYKNEDVTKMSFADDVFQCAYSNLGLLYFKDPSAVLGELLRVLAPGGAVALTFPLRGSMVEFYDILKEGLEAQRNQQGLVRLREHIDQQPIASAAVRMLEGVGFTQVKLDRHRFSLLFHSSREFFFAPLIEFGFLPLWRSIIGEKREVVNQALGWVKKAMDIYYRKRPLEVTVEVGLLQGVKPGE